GSCRYCLMSLVYSSSTFCGWTCTCPCDGSVGFITFFFACVCAGALSGAYTMAKARSALPAMAKRYFISGFPPKGFQSDIALRGSKSRQAKAPDRSFGCARSMRNGAAKGPQMQNQELCAATF